MVRLHSTLIGLNVGCSRAMSVTVILSRLNKITAGETGPSGADRDSGRRDCSLGRYFVAERKENIPYPRGQETIPRPSVTTVQFETIHGTRRQNHRRDCGRTGRPRPGRRPGGPYRAFGGGGHPSISRDFDRFRDRRLLHGENVRPANHNHKDFAGLTGTCVWRAAAL